MIQRKRSIAMVTLSILLILTITYVVNAREDIPLGEKLIRFHVIANSNSLQDQLVKNQVRDTLVEYLKLELNNLTNTKEAYEDIEDKLPLIKDITEYNLKEMGIYQEVNVTLGKTVFPTRRYGNITFPAGEYQSLRVVLGEGQGKNWWCILFPPLCFVDISHGIATNELEERLTEVIGKEEVQKLTSRNIEIELSSKFAEIFKESSARFARYFQMTFSGARKN
jgi:stage II sporulation protein R